MKQVQAPEWAVLAIIFVVSSGVYINTLHSGFTFDDLYAVVNNKDVTGDDESWWRFLLNDFWGQDISSDGSHKSYRPLTILGYRLQRKLGVPIVKGLGLGREAREEYGGLDPLPFHICNVVLHAVASCLVYRLALRLLEVLTAATSAPSATLPDLPRDGHPAEAEGARAWGAAPEALRQRRRASPAPPDTSPDVQPSGPGPAAARAGCADAQAAALLAAGLFALHPVHCEAVAGVVGQAELLSAVLSLLGMLAYLAAVEGAARLGAKGHAAADWGRHWALMAAAVASTCAAALAKEIGITAVGFMLAYELLLAPLARPHGMAGGGVLLRVLCLPRSLKTARCAVLGTAVAAYVALRSRLAVDQLVRIFRKVENPIPFSPQPARFLTTLYLHARYAGLLVAPLHLSADWSFACLRLVEAWTDPRNLLGLALYGALAAMAWRAQPWEVLGEALWRSGLQELSGMAMQLGEAFFAPEAVPPRQVQPNAGQGAPRKTTQRAAAQVWAAAGPAAAGPAALLGSSDDSPSKIRGSAGAEPSAAGAQRIQRRWPLTVAAGLIAAPFLPASNLLFPVGTFIAERLLYMPSVGACLLASAALAKLAGPGGLPPLLLLWPSEGGSEGAKGKERAVPRWRRQAAGALIAAVLGGFAARTVARNWDWVDEERLFLAAHRVCPGSAKVQLNMGILQRRYERWDAALGHFARASEIEPGYCEPGFWTGLTLLNKGGHANVDAGMKLLDAAVGCKWMSVEAVRALNAAYQAVHDANPSDTAGARAWAAVLLKPQLGRVEAACEVLEQAAIGIPPAPVSPDLDEILQPCRDALPAEPQFGQDVEPTPLQLVRACVEARASLAGVLLKHGPAAAPAKWAVYAYAGRWAPLCRWEQLAPPGRVVPAGELASAPKAASGGSGMIEGAPRGASRAHLALVHRFQAADAEDAWLQREWGEAKAAAGALPEAALHMQVAGTLLSRQLAAWAGAVEQPHVLGIGPDGRVGLQGPEKLAAAALGAFERALALGAPDTCRLLHETCQVRAHLAALAARSAGAGHGEVDALVDGARGCVEALLEQCPHYARLLGRDDE